MKTFYKIFLIAGGCVCGLGLSLMLIGCSIAGFNFENLIPEGSRMIEKTYTTDPAGLDGLEILMSNRRINLISTNDETLKLVYRVTQKQEPYTTISDELSGSRRFIRIDDSADKPWWAYIQINMFAWENNTVDIYLPKSYQNDLTLQTSNAGIRTDKLADTLTLSGRLCLKTTNHSLAVNRLQAKTIELQSTNGKVRLDSCTAEEELTVHTTNGGISLTETSAAEIAVSTTNGAVDLRKTRASGLIKAESKNSRIYCEAVTADETFFSSTNGAIELNNIAAETKLSALTTNGHISLERIVSSDIVLTSTNAAVRGTIAGAQADYNIQSITTNASNNLPTQINAIAGKFLYIKTSNGKIDVRFVD